MDECCSRMRSSFTTSTSERGSGKQYKRYENKNKVNNDKHSEITTGNDFTKTVPKLFLPPENPRPDRTHLVLDYVFNTLGQEAFATSTSTSSSDFAARKDSSSSSPSSSFSSSSSSSLTPPISILKGGREPTFTSHFSHPCFIMLVSLLCCYCS